MEALLADNPVGIVGKDERAAEGWLYRGREREREGAKEGVRKIE